MKKMLIVLSTLIGSMTFFQPANILSMAVDNNSEDFASNEQKKPGKKKKRRHKKKKVEAPSESSSSVIAGSNSQNSEDSVSDERKKPGKKKKRRRKKKNKEVSSESSSSITVDDSSPDSKDSASGEQKKPEKKKRRRRKKKNKEVSSESSSSVTVDDSSPDSKASAGSERKNSDGETSWKDDVVETSLSDEVINPIVDSSQFKFDPIKIEARPITKLARYIERIELDEKLLDKSTQLIVSNDIDDKIEKISQKTRELEYKANDSEMPVATDQLSVQIKHRKDPKESVRFRQELEKYRQIYGEMKKDGVQA